MNLNSSWYCNNNSECDLNPCLKYVNSNSDEENKALIKWAGESGIALINPDEYSVQELNRERKNHRRLLKKALEDRLDIEMDDCSLRGFGTIAENELYDRVYKETLSLIHEKYAEEFKLEHLYREEERLEELCTIGINPNCSWTSV